MVEKSEGYKTKYGSIWPTEAQALEAEARETEKEFINEFSQWGFHGGDTYSRDNNQIAAKIIIKNSKLVKRLIEKYEL